ncbi:hypothetical protein M404DRAFT_18070 [Pisolithus tinctorius Marx 270]|uniref:Uncharacterized protein n=1 Tax=Pisolithus tinctorius Marx 270 TaxID=870435 RepID=A0A0C3KW42_PISTI|nr:hypothetical protein M404DRAFT_18070 [Pisolithus tinctorius Marx 270]
MASRTPDHSHALSCTAFGHGYGVDELDGHFMINDPSMIDQRFGINAKLMQPT